ncbi:MAG: integron integrase, partial [Pseudomonadota bacterium]
MRLSPGHPTTARDTDANLDVWTRPEAGSSSSAAPRAADTPLLGKLIAAVRKRGYSIKTEQTYLHWTARFLKFHGDGSPDSLSGQDVAAFLEYLAVRRKVSASTQNIALNALAFFFERALERPLGDLGGFIRARGARRLPVVLSREEVRSLLARMGGQSWLMAALLYGTGMRLMECVRLRVLDVDFAYAQITVRQGKGGKDRVVPLPEPAVPQLREHLDRVQAIFERDRAAGFGEVYIPEALARKYPNAPKEWGWRWVFPASRRSPDPRSNASRRHHIHETVLQKAIRTAAKDAGISKRVTTHTLRH